MNTFRAPDATLYACTDDSLARPLPDALIRARSDILAAAAELLTIPETALTRPWAWIGGSEEEVRYGAYRAAEACELAEVEARAAAMAADSPATRASRIIGPSTAARWDLQGLLLSLPDESLDADPGGGEWSIREVLGHVIASQRAYAWGTAWWQANPHRLDDPTLPPQTPDAIWTDVPEERAEGAGSLVEIRARLDGILDLGTERLAGLPDDRLELGARWSGFAVSVGFRLGRWSSHLREHTIQVEKTLALLGRTPSEPERLARLLLAAYGRAESTVYGRSPEAPVADAADLVARGASQAQGAIHAARLAADEPSAR